MVCEAYSEMTTQAHLKTQRINAHKLLIEKKFGERGRNRTYNLLIKSQLLCQLSYAPFEDFC